MPDVAGGGNVSITFSSAGFTAAVVGIDLPLGTREAIRTSHLGTLVADTFMPSKLYDPGEINVTFQYDGASSVPADITGSAGNVVITFTTGAATNTFTCSAFVTNAGDISIQEGSLVTGSATLKLTGQYTHS